MDNESNSEYQPKYPFAPTFFALHDVWLQIRSKPGMYLLIWVSLALVPYLFLSQIMAGPLNDSMLRFMESLKTLSNSGEMTSQLPPGMESSIWKVLSYSGIFWFFSIIMTIFYTSVLFSTVRSFHQHIIPHYTRSLSEGLAHYGTFFKSVALSTWKIIWKPAAVFLGCMFLGSIAFNGFFASLGIVAAMVFLVPGFYRYGLVPFIQLASELPFHESIMLSQHFYNRSRISLTTLFFWLIFVPIFVSILLTAAFIRMELYTGFGGIVLWLLQSAIKFTSLMALSNFAMSFFSGIAEKSDPETEDSVSNGSEDNSTESSVSEPKYDNSPSDDTTEA